MAKLSLLQRVISPAKHSGAKKNLLNENGITSDGINDDDSCSLSDRQEKTRPSRGKMNSAARLFRRISTRNTSEEDGYESDNSAGSTRSTSSSFLRYQTRAIWKRRLTKKSVLQRKRDGSETPVEDGTKPWPTFQGIYKSQNQVLKKGEVGEDEDEEKSDDDDDGSVSSIESPLEDCTVATPAATFSIDIEDEECLDELGLSPSKQSEDSTGKESPKRGPGGESPKRGVFGAIRSFVGGSASGEMDADEEFVANEVGRNEGTPTTNPETACEASAPDHHRESPANTQAAAENEPARQNQAPSLPVDSHPVTGQESGIPTSETPKAKPVTSPAAPPSATQQDASGSPQTFPTQKLSQPSPAKNKSKERKSKSSRRKKKPDEDDRYITPTSIPPTICYSLRSAIGDGSARQRNNHSLMERRPLRPNGCSVDVSYWSHRGKRNYMEDRFVIEHVGSIRGNEQDMKLTLLAVFDGHGGSVASQFCSDWISSYIRKKNEHYPQNIPLAMKTAFIKVDKDFTLSGAFDGTTACACALVGKKVICCNAGDSRAIIIKRDGSVVALSEDHKPDRDDETKRINDLGGRVIHWGRWRVEGVLAVSRSIGDARLKPYVTAEPDIVEHDIRDDDMFLVVASDGVWDTMSSDLVAKFVLVNTCKIVDKTLQVDDKLLRWISRQVSKRARENGSADNTSCIVASLISK